MSTNFPASLDTLENPAATNGLTGHAAQHANANDAIEALQSKVGVDGSAVASSLDYRVSAIESGKGAANGYAPLGADSKVAAAYLPSYVDDVVEVATYAALPASGETGKIYVVIADETHSGATTQYRWSGTAYAIITSSPGSTDAIPEGTTNLYFTAQRVRDAVLTGLSTATNAVISATDTVLGALGKLQKQISDNLTTLTNHTGNTSNPHSVTKAQVGLNNVDNVADVDKPISTATQTALNAKANLSGALFTGAIGYGPGAGGTVTQATSKSTAVTLNKPCGRITTHNASVASSAAVVFTVNNSLVTAADTVIVTGGAGVSSYEISTKTGNNGNFVIVIRNITGTAQAEAIPINFAIIKGATS